MTTQVLRPQDVLAGRNQFGNPRSVAVPHQSFNLKAASTRPDSSARSRKKKEMNRGGIGKENRVVQKQILARQAGESSRSKEEVYAGSAIPFSPSPMQVPLPTFTMKKVKSFDDFASRDLRRLLGLN